MLAGCRWLRLTCAGGGCFAALLVASSASALSARLVYSPATDLEGCPSQLELERAVQQTLGYDPFSASAPVTVVAVVGRKPDALAASVVVFDAENRPRGHRELSAATNECAALGQALALSISIAIDPDRVSERVATAEATPPKPAPAKAEGEALQQGDVAARQPEPSPTLSAAKAVTRSRSRGLLGITAVSALGVTPAAAVGGALVGGGRWGRWSAQLEARAGAALGRTQLASGSYASWVLDWAVVPCVREGSAKLCAVGSAGTISVRSQDVDRAAADTAFFAAAGLRGGFELPLGAAWALEGHLDGLAAIVRPSVMFNGGEVWRMPLFSAALGVGAIAYFP